MQALRDPRGADAPVSAAILLLASNLIVPNSALVKARR